MNIINENENVSTIGSPSASLGFQGIIIMLDWSIKWHKLQLCHITLFSILCIMRCTDHMETEFKSVKTSDLLDIS